MDEQRKQRLGKLAHERGWALVDDGSGRYALVENGTLERVTVDRGLTADEIERALTARTRAERLGLLRNPD
jgi:hypothetical protein